MYANKYVEKYNNGTFNPVLILMLLALVLRMTTFMGVSEGDDLSYTLLAYKFANGDFTANFVFDIRWVVYLPVALLYKIFGINDITSLAPSFIYGLASIWLAYNIVKEETDKLTATIAALIYLSFPIILVYGNFLQVAPSLEFFTLLTVRSFQRGTKSENIWWFVLAGISIGGIILARSTGVFIAPLASFYLLWKRGFNKKTVLWIGVAAVCSFIIPLIQCFVYLAVHGDFFHHIKVSKASVDYTTQMTDVDPKDLFFYIRTLFTSGNFADWKKFGFNGYFIAAALLACITKLCCRKGGKERLFLIWMLSYFCFMTFAPTSISPYITLIRNNRYTIIFILPLCAIYAILLTDLLKRKSISASAAAAVILLFVVVSDIWFAEISSEKFKQRRIDQKSSVEALIQEFPNEQIYIADNNIGRRIDYYTGYKYLEHKISYTSDGRAKHSFTSTKHKRIRSFDKIKEPGVFLLIKPMKLAKNRFCIRKGENDKSCTLDKAELTKIWTAQKKVPGVKYSKKLPFFKVYKVNPKALKKNNQ